MFKTDMDDIFEEYIESNDKTVRIDGHVFHKIVCKSLMIVNRKSTVFITLLSSDYVASRRYCDERGTKFQTGLPMMVRFSEGIIPEWYKQTVTMNIIDQHIQDENDIGSYLCPLDEKEN